MRLSAAATYLLVLSLSGASASGELGIASAYPGDQGLGADPGVIFFEDFEVDAVTDLSARWGDVKNPGSLSLVPDAPVGSTGGRRSLRIVGTDTGGHLYTRLPGPQQRLYVRYYVKYASGGTYHHAGAWLGGYNPPTTWPQGGAGQRPVGSERFTVGFEPAGLELRWDFYAYWMRMRADGSGAFWGNTLSNDSSLRVRPDQWTCIEVMIEMNDPVDSTTGQLAAWIDGIRVAHLGPGFPVGTWSGGAFKPGPDGEPFEGFQWRNDPALAINFLWFQLYTTDDPPGSLWFDQVVAATEYIGPISPPDADLDGTPDDADNCPAAPNPNQADRDLDPFGDVCDLCPDYRTSDNSDLDGNGIGDPCECGDQSGDGRVDVHDLLAINLAIFDPSQATPLCDANNDDRCDVRDIISSNLKIFGRPAHCSRFPPPGP